MYLLCVEGVIRMTSGTPDWAALPSSVARREKILVTVKAYPNPSKRYIETVCVAGVTESGKWIRLYPIPYRFLEYDRQFPSYAWIDVDVRKSIESDIICTLWAAC